jgi:hypothetical protein
MDIILKRELNLCISFTVFPWWNRLKSIIVWDSGGLIQSQLDETSFRNSGNFDPIIDGTIVQKRFLL